MLSKLVLAIVVGVITFLACVLIGGLLITMSVPFVVSVGSFLKEYAGLLGLLSSLWYYFQGGGLTFNR